MALEFLLASSQYETIATNLLDTVPATGLSVVIRFKRVSTFDSDNAAPEDVWWKSNVAFDDRIWLKFIDVDGKLYFTWEEHANGLISLTSTTVSWPTGQEYLVIIVWGTTVGAELWIDNVREANNAGATTLMANGADGDFKIATHDGGTDYPDIEILDFRVYNREITDAEKASIYYGQGSDNIVTGLLCRQLMNEKPDGGTATVASSIIDISGNGNHGTPTNSPVYRAAPVRLISPVI